MHTKHYWITDDQMDSLFNICNSIPVIPVVPHEDLQLIPDTDINKDLGLKAKDSDPKAKDSKNQGQIFHWFSRTPYIIF